MKAWNSQDMKYAKPTDWSFGNAPCLQFSTCSTCSTWIRMWWHCSHSASFAAVLITFLARGAMQRHINEVQLQFSTLPFVICLIWCCIRPVRRNTTLPPTTSAASGGQSGRKFVVAAAESTPFLWSRWFWRRWGGASRHLSAQVSVLYQPVPITVFGPFRAFQVPQLRYTSRTDPWKRPHRATRPPSKESCGLRPGRLKSAGCWAKCKSCFNLESTS